MGHVSLYEERYPNHITHKVLKRQPIYNEKYLGGECHVTLH